MSEMVGDLYKVFGHLWKSSQPHQCMLFTRHSQPRCRMGRELHFARDGLLRGQYDEGRERAKGVTSCVQGGDSTKSKLSRKGNEDLRG